MSTVFVLGAGASIGAKPGGRTAFPSALQLLQRVREIYCEQGGNVCHALTTYLGRFAPLSGLDTSAGRLHPGWDHINVEELYAAIEFESLISDHLLTSFDGPASRVYHVYFSTQYRDAVMHLMQGMYQDWMRTAYSASYGSEAFPYLHDNFFSNRKDGAT